VCTAPTNAGSPRKGWSVPKGASSIPSWLSGILVAGTLGVLVALERKHPLRQATQSKWRRGLRNLAMATIAGASISVAQRPVVEPLSRLVEGRRWGLLKLI